MFRSFHRVRHFQPVVFLRGFQNWVPGKVYSPIPLKYVDLHKTYEGTLHKFVEQNLDIFAQHYDDLDTNVQKIVGKLMDFTYSEYKQVQQQRAEHPKQVPVESQPYNRLLNALYDENPQASAISSALRDLPGANDYRQANYIEHDHLESLINFSMDKSKLFLDVFRMLQTANLPTTAREKAQYLYQTFRYYRNQFMISQDHRLNPSLSSQKQHEEHQMQRQRQQEHQQKHQNEHHAGAVSLSNAVWKAEFGKLWPEILASKDTSAFNVLLKLALRSGDRDTQNLVEYHLQRPNRFTYLTKLRAYPLRAASELLKGFTDRHFVIDTIVFSSFISKMLKSRNRAQVELAEQRFERLHQSTHGIKPIHESNQRRSIDLRALDRANHIVLSMASGKVDGIQLPPLVDAVLLQRMYAHYVNVHKHTEAVKVLLTLAQQGEILPRHLVYRHIQDPSVPFETLETLFYLCCDVNTVHPQFISSSLASVWANVISSRTEMPIEEAVSLVTDSCAAVSM